MTSEALSGSEADPIFSFGEAGSFADAVWNTPAIEAAAVSNLSDPVRKDGNCLLGTALAVGIESLAALSIYAVWHFWLALR
jgi:hypothetical protein